MAIHYALFENNVTADPDDFMAVVQVIASADLDNVADQMVQGGSTLSMAT